MNKTIKRVRPLGDPWVLTVGALRVLTNKSLHELGIATEQALFEPFGRNTAPAIAFLCRVFEQKGWSHEIAGVFPADHLVSKESDFHQAVKLAEKCAGDGHIVTLGIQPDYPATGFGYIETSDDVIAEDKSVTARRALGFREKPDEATAEEFIASGRFFWNAGMFVFKVQTMIDLLKKHQPETWNCFTQLKEDFSNLEEIYNKVAADSIDYAIMEKLEEHVCIPADIGWSDMGSWEEVARLKENETQEDVVSEDSHDNYVWPVRGKAYGLVGVEDLLVVDTEDALMIARKGDSQKVKKVVSTLEERKKSQATEHVFNYRPWGKYEILADAEDFKSKVITVNPGERLSYQSHDRRAEHWIMISGEGEVTLDDEVHKVKGGDHIFIPLKAKHRIACTGKQPLRFAEVQLGDYFGEDDIVRYQDDYKR